MSTSSHVNCFRIWLFEKSGNWKFEINAVTFLHMIHLKICIKRWSIVESGSVVIYRRVIKQAKMKVYVLILVVLVVISSCCDASFPTGNKNTEANKNTKPSFNFLGFLR